MKIHHPVQTVQNIAHCMLHISKVGASRPQEVAAMLNTFTRKTLAALAKYLNIHRGTTTTRSELIRMINAKYSKLFWSVVKS